MQAMAVYRLWQTLWRERRNKLWVQPALNSGIAVLLALMAAWVPRLLPGIAFPVVSAKTLDNLLTVIASSMLAVATFSLSIMVSAFASASSGATPRATELVMGDDGTRAAISNFLSAFMFSIVAQVALGLNYYGDNGRFILFAGTLIVLAWLMLTLLRWVRTLSSLGRLNNTLTRVEAATLDCMTQFWINPFMGAARGARDADALSQQATSIVVRAADVRMVRRVDMAKLQTLAKEHDCIIHIRVRPGELVSYDDVVAIAAFDSSGRQQQSAGESNSDRGNIARAILQCFQLDQERTFDQDPRFGLIVLREAAQRALSAAINDPGTAITCLNIMLRVLLRGQEQAREHLQGRATQEIYDRLTVVELCVEDFIADGFDPIARDGAGAFEIVVRMQKLLATLTQESTDAELAQAARKHAAFACQCAMQSLNYEDDKMFVQRLHHRLFGR